MSNDEPVFVVKLTGILSPEDIERYAHKFEEQLPGRVIVTDNRVEDVHKLRGGGVMSAEHKCSQNTTQNEVWPEIRYYYGQVMGPSLTLVGSTPTSHFEHSERITFCPYCGADLRIGTGCGVDYSERP